VAGYLPKADQKSWRSKLQRAYQEPTYEAAKDRLLELKAELEQINRKAARSLQEGLEETLTLHRLGLFDELVGASRRPIASKTSMAKLSATSETSSAGITRRSAAGG
jgi:hypothetical protein